MDKILFSSLTGNWSTPKLFYDLLNAEFAFIDDPCPIGGSGGLERSWGTKTYVNPPYGRKVGIWIKYGYEESRLGKLIVFLLPARTDTKWFHNIILPYAKEIRFVKGRLLFGDPIDKSKRAPFPSMVVIFK